MQETPNIVAPPEGLKLFDLEWDPYHPDVRKNVVLGMFEGFYIMAALHIPENYDAVLKMDPQLVEHLRPWWCGYVLVPKGHPWWEYEDMAISRSMRSQDIYVHGGITCEGGIPTARTITALQDNGATGSDYHMVGFDCGHWDDKRNPKTLLYVLAEIAKLVRGARGALEA